MTNKQSQTQKRKAALEKETQRKQRQFIIVGVLFFLFVMTFALISLVRSQSNNVDGQTVAAEVGAIAPDFELVSNEGETVALSNYRGKPVAVMFMHTW